MPSLRLPFRFNEADTLGEMPEYNTREMNKNSIYSIVCVLRVFPNDTPLHQSFLRNILILEWILTVLL